MIRKFKGILFLLIFILITAGCASDSSSPDNNNGNNEGNEQENNEQEDNLFEYSFDSSISGEVTFWIFGTEQVYRDIIDEFNKEYPDVTVDLVPMPAGELHDKLQTTINTGSGAPDVAQIQEGAFTRYSVEEDLLVDLLQPPYNAGKYEELVSDYSWQRWRSIDGKRLLGMPWDVTSGVFYYREDLYEQVGLPNDPEELGEYLQDKDNVLNAVQTLAANDMYFSDWRDLPAVQYGDSLGYFDSDFNYTRNTDRMVELLDVVKEGIQLGWAPQLGYMSDEGKQMINQGKIASVFKGSFAARELSEVFPDQAGKWRATVMPLGVNVGLGGSTFVMPEQSENKDAAWAFIEWMNTAEEAWKVFTGNSVQTAWKHIAALPWYQDHENEYLGGQKDFKLYNSIDDNIPTKRLTPLDGQAWDVYIEGLNEAVNENIDSKTILNQIESDTLKQLAPEIEEIKSMMEE